MTMDTLETTLSVSANAAETSALVFPAPLVALVVARPDASPDDDDDAVVVVVLVSPPPSIRSASV